MRFKATIQPMPVQGQTKSVLPFAWFPKRIGDQFVWMERYEVLYCYETREIIANTNGQPIKFTLGAWTKVSERTI